MAACCPRAAGQLLLDDERLPVERVLGHHPFRNLVQQVDDRSLAALAQHLLLVGLRNLAGCDHLGTALDPLPMYLRQPYLRVSGGKLLRAAPRQLTNDEAAWHDSSARCKQGQNRLTLSTPGRSLPKASTSVFLSCAHQAVKLHLEHFCMMQSRSAF
eukprot:3973730-Prymnesium_polylepis.3